MVARYSLEDGGKAGSGSPSERSRRPTPAASENPGRRSWPRERRLLRRSEFEQVYSQGRRYSSPFFSAFLLKTGEPASRVGFTVPRALGKAVRRNRIRRRMREAVRLHLPEIGVGWNIVFNPRRAVLEADFAVLEQEVSRLFASAAGTGGGR